MIRGVLNKLSEIPLKPMGLERAEGASTSELTGLQTPEILESRLAQTRIEEVIGCKNKETSTLIIEEIEFCNSNVRKSKSTPRVSVSSPCLSPPMDKMKKRNSVLACQGSEREGQRGIRKRSSADYQFIAQIGVGAYGNVYKSIDRATQQIVAIKVLQKESLIREHKQRQVTVERDLLAQLSHTGIIKLFNTFSDKQHLFMVFEYMQQGTLENYLRRGGPLNLPLVQFFTAEIVSTLEYIHSSKVIHLDLKPSNILLTALMHTKIGDLGAAIRGSGIHEEVTGGTLQYSPPEVLLNGNISYSADLWSYGCLIYELLTGKTPFEGSNDQETLQNILNVDYNFPQDLPQVAKDLISKLLRKVESERLNIQEVKAHPFFKGIIDFALISLHLPPLHFSQTLNMPIRDRQPNFLIQSKNLTPYIQEEGIFNKDVVKQYTKLIILSEDVECKKWFKQYKGKLILRHNMNLQFYTRNTHKPRFEFIIGGSTENNQFTLEGNVIKIKYQSKPFTFNIKKEREWSSVLQRI